MSEFEFLRPKLDGPRFQDHAIPLDFLKDLAVFEEFVISIAKAEWRKDNPSRQRTPRGFMSGVAVKLKQVDGGSAIPVLTAFIASTVSLLPNAVSPQQIYLERARARIIEAVAAAETGGNPTAFVPAESLAYFDRFGRGLREGESMSFSRDGGVAPARLTPQTRRRLALAAPGVQFITDDAMRRGTVVDTNDADRTFTIRLANGQEVQAPLSPEHRDAILDAQKEAPGGVRVAVRGVGRFNRSDKLISFEDVEDVTPLEPLDVPTRLDELQLLKAGWLAGSGESLDPTSLDRLGQLFTAYYPSELPLPYTFPTERGGVQLEWRISGAAPEIEIDLASFRGEWLSNDEEATIDLASAKGWADLAGRIAALAGINQNGETT
jgi:hypothetical protein